MLIVVVRSGGQSVGFAVMRAFSAQARLRFISARSLTQRFTIWFAVVVVTTIARFAGGSYPSRMTRLIRLATPMVATGFAASVISSLFEMRAMLLNMTPQPSAVVAGRFVASRGRGGFRGKAALIFGNYLQ